MTAAASALSFGSTTGDANGRSLTSTLAGGSTGQSSLCSGFFISLWYTDFSYEFQPAWAKATTCLMYLSTSAHSHLQRMVFRIPVTSSDPLLRWYLNHASRRLIFTSSGKIASRFSRIGNSDI